MLFNSLEFLIGFLPITWFGAWLLGRGAAAAGGNVPWPMAALAWLLGCSLFFYAYWSPANLPLLLGSVAFNYLVGRLLAQTRHGRRLLLGIGIGLNLALLAWFKYSNFAAGIAHSLGWQGGWTEVVLPIGISFFTFQQIAFLTDVYRGQIAEFDVKRYALFVSFFPHSIAGPIVQPRELIPQFAHYRRFRLANDLAPAATIFAIGLFKKVVVADTMAKVATPVFAAAASGMAPDLITAWVGALCYTAQIYFDFSGYSDMAIGLALLFGLRFPVNFDSPYKSCSIIEFWRRWHISLSRFLREFLYIPLGGNRRGPLRRYANIFVTMLLGGVWHGAGWTFMAWGTMHGALIVLNHAWRDLGWRAPPRAIGWTATFMAVVLAWVIFRAPNLASAMAMFAGMSGVHGMSLPKLATPLLAHLPTLQHLGMRADGLGTFDHTLGLVAMPAALAVAVLMPNSQSLVGHVERMDEPLAWRPTRMAALAASTLFAIAMMKLTDVSEFIYFQF